MTRFGFALCLVFLTTVTAYAGPEDNNSTPPASDAKVITPPTAPTGSGDGSTSATPPLATSGTAGAPKIITPTTAGGGSATATGGSSSTPAGGASGSSGVPTVVVPPGGGGVIPPTVVLPPPSPPLSAEGQQLAELDRLSNIDWNGADVKMLKGNVDKIRGMKPMNETVIKARLLALSKALVSTHKDVRTHTADHLITIAQTETDKTTGEILLTKVVPWNNAAVRAQLHGIRAAEVRQPTEGELAQMIQVLEMYAKAHPTAEGRAQAAAAREGIRREMARSADWGSGVPCNILFVSVVGK